MNTIVNVIITVLGLGTIVAIVWACATNKTMNEDGSECPHCKKTKKDNHV